MSVCTYVHMCVRVCVCVCVCVCIIVLNNNDVYMHVVGTQQLLWYMHVCMYKNAITIIVTSMLLL